jgi:hypothetical protein
MDNYLIAYIVVGISVGFAAAGDGQIEKEILRQRILGNYWGYWARVGAKIGRFTIWSVLWPIYVISNIVSKHVSR